MQEPTQITQQNDLSKNPLKPMPPSSELAGTEHRQAYGTAKTENLRDTGIWRIILPGLVVLFCLSLIAVPLMILIPLLVSAVDPSSSTHGLIWLWITMMVISLGVDAVIIQGLIRIFMTQSGNYSRNPQ